MGKAPNLNKIVEKMRQGGSFSIDRKQYIKLTGIDIPQDKNYTEKRSAVSKKAKENGYKITVIPEKLIFEKI